MRKRFIVILFVIIVFLSSCAKTEIIEVDTNDLLAYMESLVLYINQPVSSRTDLDRIDLIYILFERGYLVGNFGFDGAFQPGWSIESSAVYDCLRGSFDISEKYIDQYINGEREFSVESDYYDAETYMFRFVYPLPGNPAAEIIRRDPPHKISKEDTVININGNKITVKTVIFPWCNSWEEPADEDKKSADYVFTANIVNGNIYYKLSSVKIYDDKRYVDSNPILTFGETKIKAPLYTVHRNGQVEFFSSHTQINTRDGGFDEYSNFEPTDIRLNTSQDKYVVMIDGIAYININYYGICDTYIYDPQSGTGHWMYGIDSFDDTYEEEIAFQQDTTREGYPHFPYYLSQIITVSKNNDYALMRRSKEAGELPGEYYMYNFKTGEEMYVCDSFTKLYYTTSNMEGSQWLDDNRLVLHTVLDPINILYLIVYDGQSWSVTETDYGNIE